MPHNWHTQAEEVVAAQRNFPAEETPVALHNCCSLPVAHQTLQAAGQPESLVPSCTQGGVQGRRTLEKAWHTIEKAGTFEQMPQTLARRRTSRVLASLARW